MISDMSFSLREGELCGLLGPNGSGKSTLLRTILDIGPSWSGSVRICGLDSAALGRLERARKVSFLPQEYNIASRLTVRETVLLGRHPHRPPWQGDSEEDLEIAAECMAMTGVESLSGRSFAELSGGERRLVMLASALAQQPKLLLLDEPGSSLDFRHAVDLWVLLDRLAAAGLTILASTHELNTAARFLDSVLLLEGGVCRAFGTPAEVCTPELLGSVFGVALEVRPDGGGGILVIPAVGGSS